MGNVLPVNGDAYRAAMAWSVLRRIRRRQDALRRRWYELPREQVEAELLAIGRELVKAAPLFLPRCLDSGGDPGRGDNGNAFAPNGHYASPEAHAHPHPVPNPCDFPQAQPRRGKDGQECDSQDETLKALMSHGERLLDALNRLLAELEDGTPDADPAS